MNNNSVKSVSDSSNKSKASHQRKSRQDGYRKKFGNRPHMIIPQEDLAWLKGKNNQVKELFIDCWTSDPYGSRWMPLSHSLKQTSFRIAKKALSEAGLFVFRQISSIRDAREKVYWEVLNLHGSRVQEYWLAQKNEVENARGNDENATKHHETARGKNGIPLGISSKSYTQSGSQNPSETSQERLSNSSKELLETLPTETEVSDRDRDIALEEQITSASLPNENQVQSLHSFHCVPVVPDCLKKEEEAKTKSVEEQKSMGAACPQTPRGQKGKEINTPPNEEILNQEYIHNPQSEEAVVRSVAQNLAIEAQKTTEEYQSSSKEFYDRINAIKDELRKKAKEEREANLRGDSLITLSERQALEEYKREIETNRKKQAEEESGDFWDF